jgi:hypothetical protein
MRVGNITVGLVVAAFAAAMLALAALNFTWYARASGETPQFNLAAGIVFASAGAALAYGAWWVARRA